VKAVVIAAGSAEASITASAAPSPAPNESLVRVRRVLLAAEDHLDFARRRGFTGVPGSIFSGVVEQSGARGPAVGARVVAEAAVPCGTCAACRSGLSPACPDRTIAGLLGRDGALAELVAMPSAQLVELPEAVDDDRAVFAPLLGTGLLLDRRLGLGEAAFITVIGRGVAPIAATLALRARHPRARLLSDDPQTAAAAERLSLAHRPIGDAGRRRDQDAVVDFDATPRTIETAIGMIRPRGQIAVAGNGWESIDASMLRSLRHVEASLHGVGRGLAADGLPLLARRSIDPLPLLARRVGLEEAASWLGGGSPSDLDGTLATIGSEPRAGGNPS
jgi:threonine dehydrogenase-like Zn-dependent dehydrogenase